MASVGFSLCAGQVIADHLDQQPAEHQEYRDEDHCAEELDHSQDADLHEHDGVIRQRVRVSERVRVSGFGYLTFAPCSERSLPAAIHFVQQPLIDASRMFDVPDPDRFFTFEFELSIKERRTCF